MTSLSPNKKFVPSPPGAKGTAKPTFANTAPTTNQKEGRSSSSTSKQQQQKVPEYIRHAEAQARALEKWSKQQGEWNQVTRSVADKAHKSESATLSATTHLFREKIEETGKIETAVPAAIRSHASNAWEMGLRGGGSATRYERVGSSYPFPLYCPIKANDQVSNDHTALTHILYPPDVTQKVNKKELHSKPVMESQFFKGRQNEFSSLINKKFAHFQATEYFDVQGSPAPRTDVAPREDSQQRQPAVQFIPMEAKDGEAVIDPTGATTHAITIRNLIAQQQLANNNSLGQQERDSASNNMKQQAGKSSGDPNATPSTSQQHVAPLSSAAVKQQQLPPQTPQTVGPQIVISTNNLSFTTNSPDEVKQAIITLDNTGSTAIYYQWAAVPAAPAVLVNGLPGGINNNNTDQSGAQQESSGLSDNNNNNNVSQQGQVQQQQQQTPSSQMDSPFSLASPVTGSVLPESMKMFCFSFRAKSPGIYTQHMELITVPSGRERIVVTLRGVALAPSCDPITVNEIETDLNNKCKLTLAEEILRGDIINNVCENAFDVSNAASAVKKREDEIQAERDAPTKLREERKVLWKKSNKNAQIKERLPFCEAAYAALETIRTRCNEFRSEFESSLAPSKTKLRQQAAALEQSTRKGGGKDQPTPRGKKNDDDDLEPPPDRNVQLVGSIPEKWSGSLRSLYEDVSTLRTTKARNAATEAVNAIHRALEANSSSSRTSSAQDEEEQEQQHVSSPSSSSSSSLDTTSLSDLLWISAGHSWLGGAFEKFDRTMLLAESRVENRAICHSKGVNVYGVQAKKGGAGGGGGGASGANDRASTPIHALGADLNGPTSPSNAQGTAAFATSTKRGTNAKQDAAAIAAAQAAAAHQQNQKNPLLTPDEVAFEARELKEQSIKQLLLGSIMGMISTHDRDLETVEAATCLPLSSLIIDEVEQVLEHRDMDAEPQADTDKKKRK